MISPKKQEIVEFYFGKPGVEAIKNIRENRIEKYVVVPATLEAATREALEIATQKPRLLLEEWVEEKGRNPYEKEVRKRWLLVKTGEEGKASETRREIRKSYLQNAKTEKEAKEMLLEDLLHWDPGRKTDPESLNLAQRSAEYWWSLATAEELTKSRGWPGARR